MGADIWSRCITGVLGSKARLLVLHDRRYAASPAVDRVLVLQNGAVLARGPFAAVAPSLPDDITQSPAGDDVDTVATVPMPVPLARSLSQDSTATTGSAASQEGDVAEDSAATKAAATEALITAKTQDVHVEWRHLVSYLRAFGAWPLVGLVAGFVLRQVCDRPIDPRQCRQGLTLTVVVALCVVARLRTCVAAT